MYMKNILILSHARLFESLVWALGNWQTLISYSWDQAKTVNILVEIINDRTYQVP